MMHREQFTFQYTITPMPFRDTARPHHAALIPAVLLAALLAPNPAAGQSALPPAMRAAVDSAAREVLATTGAPSASVAVVRYGTLVYANAYGMAHLDPPAPATPAMRYSIGSISKQFTATAVLLLAERHKLSLDDKIAKWLPDLTRANEVTLRQVLSMTSGYQAVNRLIKKNPLGCCIGR